MHQKFLAIAVFFLMAFHFANGQQSENADSLFALAQSQNKNILLIFSGSDWCAQCIRFEKKVLDDPAFTQFADSNLILITADFPQGKKQSSEIKKQNEELAERYNPSGKFPLILMLRPDGSVLRELNYQNESASEFISMINRFQQ